MKKIFIISFFPLFPYFLFAQVDLGLPGSTGKGGVANGIVKDWECIGINPANLGWESNYRFSVSTMIFGISAQSKALDYSQLKTAILHPSDTFSTASKINYASLFTDKDGLNLQSNLNWLTFSVAVPKVGGFAWNVRDRTFGHVRLNQNAADILFLGTNAPIFQDTLAFLQNMSKIFDGSNVSFMHYREMNFAYGTKIIGFGGTKDSSKVSIYGGIGFKYLWGLGNFEMKAENGVLTGRSAFSSKYGINYGTIQNFTPETTTGIFPSVGNGTAFDLGTGIGIGKIKITLSATDIGQIKWSKNVLVADDTLMPDTSQFNFQGIDSWNMSQQANNLFNDSGIVKFKPGSPYTTVLPSRFRLGIGFKVTKRFSVGADVVTPMSKNPGNLENAYFAVGFQADLASNFFVSAGVAGNSTYGFSIPFGITLGRFFKIMEVSIATNDLLTYISPGSNPNISLAISVFRFNLDKKK